MRYVDCPGCGLMADAGADVCRFCGTALRAAEAPVPASAVAAGATASPPTGWPAAGPGGDPGPAAPVAPPAWPWPGAESPPPMAPIPARGPRRARLATAVVVLAVVAVTGVVYVRRETGPSHPERWDPRIEDEVAFVEANRGLRFEHPVHVDFVTAEVYSERTRPDRDLAAEQEDELRTVVGQLRALGLANGDLDLVEAVGDLADAGTLAFYDARTDRIVVRGTELTVAVRVTIVHELVHALQDQHFGIGQARDDDLDTDGAREAFLALVEGDAQRVEHEYVASLSPGDRERYVAASTGEVDRASEELAQVPVALQALQMAPYSLGQPYVASLAAEGGDAAVDEALRDPPRALAPLFQPGSAIADGEPASVHAPAVPDGSDGPSDEGEFGAVAWYVMLAERVDPVAALDAVDGWAGDAYSVYEKDGRTCMGIAFRGGSDTDADQMATVATAWATAMPAGAATVTAEDDLVEVRSCDPGADGGAPVEGRSMDALAMVSARAELTAQALEEGAPRDVAVRFGDCVVHRLDYGQVFAGGAFAGPLSAELQEVLRQTAAACIAA